KAFDTVSHNHILLTLKQRGLDEHIIALIENMHQQTNTKGRGLDPIWIKKGVKQGDPLSPLLFNLSIDPLMCMLETNGCGYQHCGSQITTLAFADDLVLLSESWEGMQKNIKIVEAFCELKGPQHSGEE
ncbi:PO21 protein, partial [Geococcyx californianus]|nr:PO21 protein [Geococcyx californianus]